MKTKLSCLLKSKTFISISASILSIIIGLLIGFIVLLLTNPKYAIGGFSNLLTSGVSSSQRIGKVLYGAAPLIMVGLSVGFAFKTGLFNIGAPGQYLMGAFFALVGALVFNLPWWVNMILAGIGGMLWGTIVGVFKALLNVNEVITAIMFNWIGLFIVNLSIANIPIMLSSTHGGFDPSRTANLPVVNPSAIIPSLGLDQFSRYLNIGIFIAIFIAIIIHVILNKTTFGYELKAVGLNKNASKNAGINEKKNIILSMAIAGLLAGIGGSISYLAGTTSYQILKVLQVMGFNGIPVALLAGSNPVGIIFSSLFVSYITVGGEGMQPYFSIENINIIISIIIYLSAFSFILQNIIRKLYKKVDKKLFEKLPQIESKEE